MTSNEYLEELRVLLQAKAIEAGLSWPLELGLRELEVLPGLIIDTNGESYGRLGRRWRLTGVNVFTRAISPGFQHVSQAFRGDPVRVVDRVFKVCVKRAAELKKANAVWRQRVDGYRTAAEAGGFRVTEESPAHDREGPKLVLCCGGPRVAILDLKSGALELTWKVEAETAQAFFVGLRHLRGLSGEETK